MPGSTGNSLPFGKVRLIALGLILITTGQMMHGCSSDQPATDAQLPAVSSSPPTAPALICSEPILSAQHINLPVKTIGNANRHQFLTQSLSRLRAGSEIQVVALGDSIVADAFGPQIGASGFHTSMAGGLSAVSDHFKVPVWTVVSVRGSTGAWWYRESGRIQEYVLNYLPDLVIIGGISHNNDIAAIRDVVDQIRGANPAIEIVLSTGAVNLQETPTVADLEISDPDSFRAQLRDLAAELSTGFLDMRGPYDQFILDASEASPGVEFDFFQRDRIHANEFGKTVLATILLQFFVPGTPCDPA